MTKDLILIPVIFAACILWAWIGRDMGKQEVTITMEKTGKYCVTPHKDLPMLKKCWILKEFKDITEVKDGDPA